MSDALTQQTGAEGARALMEAEGLPFPPMPAPMAAALSEIQPHVFATRSFEDSPYSVEVYVGAALGPDPVPDYALLGVAGHGVNSWALHYFLVEAGLALFVQLPWAGAYTEVEAARAEIAKTFEWAAVLQENVRRAVAEGRIPEGWRLVAVVSAFAGPRFAWAPANAAEAGTVDWTYTRDVQEAVDAALASVVAGETRLG